MDYVIINCARDCLIKYFHSFTFRRIYDIEMKNAEFLNGMISDKKLENMIRESGFIHKRIIRTYSSLSNINICYLLNFPTPIMHRHFLRILSQNPEYERTPCNDRNISFHFPIRKWN